MKKFSSHYRGICFAIVTLLFMSAIGAQSNTLIGKKLNTRLPELNESFAQYEVYELDITTAQALTKSGQPFAFKLQLNQQSWDVKLEHHDLRGPHYREVALTPKGPEVLPYRPNITFRGLIDGEETRFTITDNYLIARLQRGDKVYYLEPLSRLIKGTPTNQYVYYEISDILADPNVECAHLSGKRYAPPHPDDPKGTTDPLKMMECLEVELATAGDFTMFQKYGSVVAVNDFIINVTNLMEPLYAVFDIDFVIVDQFVATTLASDPFDAAGDEAFDILDAFRPWAGANFITHDLGQLWTDKDIRGCNNDDVNDNSTNFGLIGCADAIGDICGSNRYNLCEDWSASSNCLRNISAHEIGHVFDGIHSLGPDAVMDMMGPSIACTETAFSAANTARMQAHIDSRTCLADCSPCASDMDAPEITCGTFSMTFNRCPFPLGPNTPSMDWTPINGSGIIQVFAGGSSVIDVNLNGCVTDATSGFADMEYMIVESYQEGTCPKSIFNEIILRDECGNETTDRIIVEHIFEEMTPPTITSCAPDVTVSCDTDISGDAGTITGTSTGSSTTTLSWPTTQIGVIGTLEAPVAGVPAGATITDVNVRLQADHSWVGDLTVVITSPGGSTATVLQNPACGSTSAFGSNGDNINVVFDDQAAPFNCVGLTNNPVTANTCPQNYLSGATVSGTMQPSTDNLSVFNGENPNGTWTATISDAANGDSGCFDNFEVMISWEAEGNTGEPSTGVPVASDACSPASSITYAFTDESTQGTSGCSQYNYTVTRTWTAFDACGNASDPCVQIITVESVAPTIICPANTTILCTDSTAPANTGEATGDDSCGSTTTITFSDNFTPGCNPSSGTIIRTWTATNECGLASSCDQIITIVDETAPVFDLACQIDATFFTEDGGVCPADATISLNEGDEIDVFTGWTVGGVSILPLQGCVSDNCTPEEDLTIVVDDITVSDVGTCSRTITITFLANDGCGNTSDPFVCNYTFIDDTAPVFDLACQIDAVFTTEDGNVCPADATISLSEGDEIDVFTGWTVGGVAILPLQGCVDDNCTAEGDLTITVDDITVVDDGTCSRVITVTFIADDGCGNFSDPFVCNYTFIDNTGPIVSFNGIPDGGTYVIECDLPSTTWDPLTDIGELTITDNCSAIDFAGITEVLTQLYDGPCVGNVLTRWQQVFTVQDVCGNTTVYTLFTEIIDTTPPAFTSSPADVTIECDETAPVPELEAFDSCSEVIYNYNEVRTDGDCPNNYTLTRTWLASDGCGNTSVETQIVTVEDTTPPVIEFTDEYVSAYTPGQDVFIECSEYGNISLIIANAALAFDNCSGSVPTTYDLQDLGGFDCAEFGYSGHLISTWKAVDECGNESVATINWFLVDETAPTFQGLPEDACASLDNLPPVADVQAVDDCELAVLTFSQSDPIDCDGGQYIERTWNAEDVCGNSASYTQRITLGGNSNGPTITIDYPEIGDVMDGDLVQLPVDCDQDIAFSVQDLEAAISVSSGCGSGSSSIELTLMDEGDCQENGYFARYRLNVTATDACGNTSSLSITIDFVDMTPPVVSSPNELTLNCGDEIPMIEATDACGEIASMTFVDSAPIEASCSANPVAYDRTWTVTDACGNATTFVQSIIVIDNAGPVFSGVPADMCNNTGIDVVVTAIDGCTGQQAQVSFNEVMSNEAGCGQVLTRTWTATDACGNTSVATQQVFFTDAVAPTIAFTSDLLFGLESGDDLFLTVGDGLGDPSNPLFLTADDVTVTDNCATITAEVTMETILSEDCAADGYLARYEYKFIATDPCGNTNAAKLTVFYVDGNAPNFFNVPEDVEVFCTAIPEVANVIASDDYDEEVEVFFSETQTATAEGILITRTWKAADSCGNTNAVSQNILVVNNDINATFSFGSPVIECNSDNNRLGVTPTGGTPPYTYQWQLTFPLEDGYITTDPTRPAILFTMGYITQTFTVLITDANGCEYAASVTVVCDFSDDEGDFISGGNDGSISMNVYPNPANEQLLVKANVQEDTPVTVAMYNLFGQELFRTEQDTWAPEGLSIDTRRFPNGTYLLRLTADGQEVQTREVVILH